MSRNIQSVELLSEGVKLQMKIDHLQSKARVEDLGIIQICQNQLDKICGLINDQPAPETQIEDHKIAIRSIIQRRKYLSALEKWIAQAEMATSSLIKEANALSLQQRQNDIAMHISYVEHSFGEVVDVGSLVRARNCFSELEEGEIREGCSTEVVQDYCGQYEHLKLMANLNNVKMENIILLQQVKDLEASHVEDSTKLQCLSNDTAGLEESATSFFEPPSYPDYADTPPEILSILGFQGIRDMISSEIGGCLEKLRG